MNEKRQGILELQSLKRGDEGSPVISSCPRSKTYAVAVEKGGTCFFMLCIDRAVTIKAF